MGQAIVPPQRYKPAKYQQFEPKYYLLLLGISLGTFFLVSLKFRRLNTLRWETMANYPQEFAQDAVCQSHTRHMNGLWFLPARPPRLNTDE